MQGCQSLFSCWSGSNRVHWPAGEFMVALCLCSVAGHVKKGHIGRRFHGGPMPCSVAGQVQKGYIGQLANSWWPYALFSCWSGLNGVHRPAGGFMVALCLVQLLVMFRRGILASWRIHGGPMPLLSCWSCSEGVNRPAGKFVVALCLVQLLVRFRRGTLASRRIHGGPLPLATLCKCNPWWNQTTHIVCSQ